MIFFFKSTFLKTNQLSAYYLLLYFPAKGTKTRFLDTLSLHMCISGQTTLQRALWHVNQKGGEGGAALGLRKQQKKKSFGTPVSPFLTRCRQINFAITHIFH